MALAAAAKLLLLLGCVTGSAALHLRWLPLGDSITWGELGFEHQSRRN